MADLASAAIIAGRHVGTLRTWIENWCAAADRIVSRWESWVTEFQLLALRADAEELQESVALGEPIVNELRTVMAERKTLLSTLSVPSIRSLLEDAAPDHAALIRTVVQLEKRIQHLKRVCTSQWIASSQTAQFADQLLFIVRSGNQKPATYTDDELDAFQGGMVLDSTA